MRTKFLAVFFLFSGLATMPVAAQNFNFGVEAGANASNLIGSGMTAISPSLLTSKLGFVGGAYLCLNFGSSFAIRPEVLYEQKGQSFNGTSSTDELDYIEVPVLLKFSLGTPGINPGILLGPAFSWNMLAQEAGTTISNLNTSDIGIIGGLEVDIDKFLISGRYELGLQDIQQNSHIQNGTITVLAGYSFM
jgi:hypothetical protein